jgi:tetratricopeptide (TPR) repeat protein
MKLGSAVAVPALIAGLLGEASLTANNRVRREVTDELRRRMVRLRRIDDHLGGADTYHLYVADANVTARLLKEGSYSDSTQRELLSIYAEQAQQAGWSAFDAGWTSQATNLYQRSYAAAMEAEDVGLAGNALALRAYQMVGEGRPAAEMTDMSIRTAEVGGAHPGVLALLYERGAWTYALAGDVEATARALGHAKAALAQTAVNTPDYAAWVDETELQIMAGRCWTELRKPLRAVPALEQALSTYSDNHARDKALYLSWLADSYIDAAEHERATEIVGQAAELARDVASTRPRKRLRAVLNRLGHNTELATLVDRLSASNTIYPVNIGG